MIIKKELSVSGRKKAEIIKDLRSKGFKTFAKAPKAAVAEGTEEPQEEEEAEDNTSENGYDYLLTVNVPVGPTDFTDAYLRSYSRESKPIT